MTDVGNFSTPGDARAVDEANATFHALGNSTQAIAAKVIGKGYNASKAVFINFVTECEKHAAEPTQKKLLGVLNLKKLECDLINATGVELETLKKVPTRGPPACVQVVPGYHPARVVRGPARSLRVGLLLLLQHTYPSISPLSTPRHCLLLPPLVPPPAPPVPAAASPSAPRCACVG